MSRVINSGGRVYFGDYDARMRGINLAPGTVAQRIKDNEMPNAELWDAYGIGNPKVGSVVEAVSDADCVDGVVRGNGCCRSCSTGGRW